MVPVCRQNQNQNQILRAALIGYNPPLFFFQSIHTADMLHRRISRIAITIKVRIKLEKHKISKIQWYGG